MQRYVEIAERQDGGVTAFFDPRQPFDESKAVRSLTRANERATQSKQPETRE
jgi:hypothetical protein